MVEKKRWRLAPKRRMGELKNNYVYLGCMKVIFFLFPKITSREQKATAESRAETTCLDNISSRRLGKKGETFKKEEKAEYGDSRPPVWATNKT